MSQVRPSLVPSQFTLIAVGSNVTSLWGEADVTVSEALKRLEIALGVPMARSRMYHTPAYPAGAGPDFVNGAVAVQTDIAADHILAILHQIEAAALRTRDVRWGQRTLDLDLIACGQAVLPDAAGLQYWLDLPPEQQMAQTPAELILPHPRMQDRAFVLQPLSDVAPDWVHPVLGLSVTQMLAQCSAADRASVVPVQ
jgi:2-amino-4-hydroxy-6-hydroxymethyldihydropteridine diphosphokinase